MVVIIVVVGWITMQAKIYISRFRQSCFSYKAVENQWVVLLSIDDSQLNSLEPVLNCRFYIRVNLCVEHHRCKQRGLLCSAQGQHSKKGNPFNNILSYYCLPMVSMWSLCYFLHFWYLIDISDYVINPVPLEFLFICLGHSCIHRMAF